VQRRFLEELGFPLPGGSFSELVMKTPDDLFPSVVEATVALFDDDSVVGKINQVFDEHRIAFELVEGQMVEIESKELHQEVVAPTLRLLSGRAGWDAVEEAYHDALEEIAKNPGDAITDAGRALQTALELLGCEGNSLGPLVKSARKKGLLAGHDERLLEAVVDWVSADRSEKGDAHKSASVSRDDAWFTVHVVGAVLLRLVGEPRG
jgi:hypothetical protein